MALGSAASALLFRCLLSVPKAFEACPDELGLVMFGRMLDQSLDQLSLGKNDNSNLNGVKAQILWHSPEVCTS